MFQFSTRLPCRPPPTTRRPVPPSSPRITFIFDTRCLAYNAFASSPWFLLSLSPPPALLCKPERRFIKQPPSHTSHSLLYPPLLYIPLSHPTPSHLTSCNDPPCLRPRPFSSFSIQPCLCLQLARHATLSTAQNSIAQSPLVPLSPAQNIAAAVPRPTSA
jgi:hypothetical protein